MSATLNPSRTRIDTVEVHCYQGPTATGAESDGTLTWNSTAITVVELHADGVTGLGYSYCHPAARTVIETKLSSVLVEADPCMPERSWAHMQVELRQLGHAGLAMMARSAVDIALWDLKAKLIDVCLADALPRFHESVAIYGSGGFTNLTEDQLREQVHEWVRAGCRSMKIKVGRDKLADPSRIDVVREEAGPDAELMVDGNGAYTVPEALLWGECFRGQGVDYFEEPVSSENLRGLAEVRRRAPAGLSIAGGEYGWDVPYYGQMLDADAVHILQADVTRCGGITNLIRIDGLCKARNLPFSAHCAPAVSAHAGCAMESVLHIEYFYDHKRIERMLFDGTLDPCAGRLTPDREPPGLGIELKRDEAARFAV
ncbi:MAG: enolase C-terminal domain-like protein [Solirubrobacteraceae bacterium]